MKRLLFLLLLLGVAQTPLFGGEQYTIIAHPSIRQGALSAAELRNVYLGKKSRWNDSSVIVPTKLRSGATDGRFLKGVVKKTPGQFRIYWKRAIFTGTRVPYQVFDTEEKLIEFVASTPGAVGYISPRHEAALPEGVKLLRVE